MKTYQDLMIEMGKGQDSLFSFIETAISEHKSSEAYKIALDASNYDRQQNTTIINYVKYIYNSLKIKTVDTLASNNKLCSNIFHRLNTQRCLYSLGNGVTFTKDSTKERLGKSFDNQLKDGAYKSLIHGLAFGFWNNDHLDIFDFLQFVPLWDEETSKLRAGIRFWQLDSDKPLYIRLYLEGGSIKFVKRKGKKIEEVEQSKYLRIVKSTELGGVEGIENENYQGFPIVPIWSNSLHQSTFVGMKGKLDAIDLISSGICNDVNDFSEVYWLINNASGMDRRDIAEFRARLKFDHVAIVDDENSSVQPFTQDVPTASRVETLNYLKKSIYEDFGGLDVHEISATSTNDHIDAAYQPLDEEADDFELQLIKFIHNILELLGIDDEPIFKRNRISNQKEQTDMVLSASEYLDDETVLKKLPFVSIDEINEILKKKEEESANRFNEDINLVNKENDEDDEDDEDSNKIIDRNQKKEE